MSTWIRIWGLGFRVWGLLFGVSVFGSWEHGEVMGEEEEEGRRKRRKEEKRKKRRGMGRGITWMR